jgi:two-component system, response regulator PdtaR
MGVAGGDAVPSVQASRPHVVLIVEDEVLIRMMLADHLRAAGFRVIECHRTADAIAVLRSTSDVDAVVTDVRLPGEIDGIDLARLVRSDFAHIKVLLASGHLPRADGVDHDGFFRKPYNVDRLVARLNALLR